MLSETGLAIESGFLMMGYFRNGCIRQFKANCGIYLGLNFPRPSRIIARIAHNLRFRDGFGMCS